MSLLDNWNDDDDDYDDEPAQSSVADALLTGAGGGHFVDVEPPKAEAPVFSLDLVEFSPPHNILNMVVSSNILVMALANCHIIRLNLANPSKLLDVEISRKSTDSIHKLHLDPTGNHLLIAMKNEESFYIHSQWKKPRALKHLRGIVVESVAWDTQETTKDFTNEILLGTTTGRIFQTSIEASEKGLVEKFVSGSKDQKNFKQVCALGDQHPITGLRAERFPAARGAEPKFVVIATTPTRIYQFVGGPTFDALFHAYASSPSFQEVPGTTARSQLHFWAPMAGALPKSFAWLTGPGVFHGDLLFGSQNKGDSVTTDTTLLPYPRLQGEPTPTPPLALSLTEFHFCLIDEHKFSAIHKLTEQVVFEQEIPATVGKVRGLASDNVERTIWAYTDKRVFEVTVTDEARDVWQMYLDRNQFETALRHCKTAAQKDRVWSAQGDYLFAQGSYDLAASVYARTMRSFEELALLFIGKQERGALRTLLLKKLSRMDAKRDATQMTVLCTWLVEIHLERLNAVRDELAKIDQSQPGSGAAALKSRLQMCRDDLSGFLRDWKQHLDRRTTLSLLAAHGCDEELLAYASLCGDNARVIEHHLQAKQWGKALDVLCKQDDLELYYKFSPELMHHLPYDTVNVWIGEGRLKPRRLIPALMRYDIKNNPAGERENQALRYLEHCVYRVRDTRRDGAVDDYLLSLYAQEKDDAALLRFLSQPSTLQTIDLKYALRTCNKYNQKRACVLIYSALGLHEEAVNLALEVDIALAKEHADKPEDNDEMRKRLWLAIARHVVQSKRDIKTAMSFLQECDLLQIEDILPFFPDFTRIDEFRDEICASLEDYGTHIQKLKQTMNEATKSADLIRNDVKELRNKYGFISGGRRCDLCKYTAMSRQFYLFPCEHVFHADCLTKEVLENASAATRRRVAELARELATHNVEQTTDDVLESGVEQVRAELNSLVAGACVFCGEIMMRSIAKPFVDAVNEQAEIQSWAV